MPGGHGTPAGQGLGPKRGGRPSERRSEQSDRRGTLAGRPPREPPCRHGGDVQPRRPAEHRCLRGAEGPLAWAVRTSPLRPRAPRAPLPPAVREHVARAHPGAFALAATSPRTLVSRLYVLLPPQRGFPGRRLPPCPSPRAPAHAPAPTWTVASAARPRHALVRSRRAGASLALPSLHPGVCP